MKGLTSDYQLNLSAVLRRAEQLYGSKEIVTRKPDKSFHRYTYADFVSRAKKLAVAVQNLGLQKGDRVATLAWNSHEHLEAYFGVPCAGAVLHTINPRLSPDDLAYIINHAEDKVLAHRRDDGATVGHRRGRDRPGTRLRVRLGAGRVRELRGSAWKGPTKASSSTRTSTRTTRRRCATPRGRRGVRRGRCTRTARSACTPWPRRWPTP